ncbi:MAG: MurT ligase domain-containing protein [Oscillospiraceae bacterium]
MMKLRFFAALWAAKLSRPLLKITKHNGTNFPGELALKICPDFLKYIGKPKKIIAVTGTNGKTTVSNMACDILERSGKKVLNNRAGSNINSGISTSLLIGCSIFNKPKYDIAVLEVDERSSKRIYPYVKPDIVVITNLFRDSIMRNAHPQYIADFLTSAMPAETKLILNADDLISFSVAPENPRMYFGIEKMDTDVVDCVNLINDIRICPKCSGELKYEYRRYHHIGRAYCEQCGFKSPEYDYAGADVDIPNMKMTVKDAAGSHEYRLLSDGVFNIYNMVTVIALMRELGMSHDEIFGYLKDVKIVESRYKAESVGNVTLVMQMAKEKNALACSRAFDYVAHQPGEKELFLMMNCLGDEKHWSENTCWLYDCDFEFLKGDDITHIVATGPRAKDYRLRLLIAGVPDEKIDCVQDEFDAAEKLRFSPDSSVFMFYGTDSLSLAFKVREKVKTLAQEAAK